MARVKMFGFPILELVLHLVRSSATSKLNTSQLESFTIVKLFDFGKVRTRSNLFMDGDSDEKKIDNEMCSNPQLRGPCKF